MAKIALTLLLKRYLPFTQVLRLGDIIHFSIQNFFTPIIKRQNLQRSNSILVIRFEALNPTIRVV